MKNFIFKVALCIVSLGLVGCDGISYANIEKPLVKKELNNRGYLSLRVQSQDNETIIQDIVINRGNCPVEKYQLNDEKYKIYKQDPDSFNASFKGVLKNKKGEFLGVGWSEYGNRQHTITHILYSNKKDIDFYNDLNDKSKAVYENSFPKKLAFGQTYTISKKCDTENIIEVLLVVNGEKLTYKF